MPTSDSDVETVLGEDSPLSPCIWTALEREERDVVKETEQSEAPAPQQDSREAPVAPPPLRGLLLSPASQLNVLSQISELADAQSRQDAPRQSLGPRTQVHVWAPSSEKTKRKENTRPSNSRPKAKKQKTTRQKQPPTSQTKRLAEDMVDWETCSEGDLFNSDEDQWVYEDISDSDFDA
ncbi:hypothetical protein V7S43_018714 [Phytophthora oleae]|uniref:Uncharacterized protein n=1 Tax=Phytophthora oleae TaxID=2107226 RepID=A0ABD3ET30_9STRA